MTSSSNSAADESPHAKKKQPFTPENTAMPQIQLRTACRSAFLKPRPSSHIRKDDNLPKKHALSNCGGLLASLCHFEIVFSYPANGSDLAKLNTDPLVAVHLSTQTSLPSTLIDRGSENEIDATRRAKPVRTPVTKRFMTQRAHHMRYSTSHLPSNVSLDVVLRTGFLALLWGTFFWGVAFTPATAAELTIGEAGKVGVDHQLLRQAASLIEETVAKDKIPGAVILVARKGKIILHQAFGHRDLQRTRRMQTDSLFRMASNSKAITAAGIMLLVDEGKLNLDKSVGTYLESFRNERWSEITLRHLLTHTSGIRIKPLFFTPLLQKSAIHPQAPDLRLEVNRFAASAPLEPAGKTYSYNNACYNTLAAIIEEVTGSYKQHLHDRIYKPLGMLDSCNHESEADHSRMSTVLRRRQDGTWSEGWKPGDAPDWPFPRGSGGMVSSARDYALFCQMLLNNGQYGNKQILQSNSVTEMTNPQVKHCQAAINYGLGWTVSERGSTFSHTGSDGTFVWVDPSRELIGMLLTQCNGIKPPRTEFRKLVESACTPPAPIVGENHGQ